MKSQIVLTKIVLFFSSLMDIYRPIITKLTTYTYKTVKIFLKIAYGKRNLKNKKKQ